jgi:hypothetical protein
MGGSLAPVRVAGFTWNRWQPSAVYAVVVEELTPARKVLVGGEDDGSVFVQAVD